MDFGTALFLLVLVTVPVAAILFAGGFGLLDELGRGGLSIDENSRPPGPPPDTAAGRMEREEEIRQLLQARHDRQVARGEPPVDVASEVRRLMELSEPREQSSDAALREEVRQLAIARNARRAARGEAPLDVEAEIERQLRDAGA
jgi:hypothetical protein